MIRILFHVISVAKKTRGLFTQNQGWLPGKIYEYVDQKVKNMRTFTAALGKRNKSSPRTTVDNCFEDNWNFIGKGTLFCKYGYHYQYLALNCTVIHVLQGKMLEYLFLVIPMYALQLDSLYRIFLFNHNTSLISQPKTLSMRFRMLAVSALKILNKNKNKVGTFWSPIELNRFF